MVGTTLLLFGCGSDGNGGGRVIAGNDSLAAAFGGQIPHSLRITPYGSDEVYVAGIVPGEGVVTAICDPLSSCRSTPATDVEQSGQVTVGIALATSRDGGSVFQIQLICRLGDGDVCEEDGRVISLVDVSPGTAHAIYGIEPALFGSTAPNEAWVRAAVSDNKRVTLVISGNEQSSTALAVDGRSGDLLAERELPGVLNQLTIQDDGTALVVTETATVQPPAMHTLDQELEHETGTVSAHLYSFGPTGEHRRLGTVDAAGGRLLPLGDSLVHIDPNSGMAVDVVSGHEVGGLTPIDLVETDRLGGDVSCGGSFNGAVAMEFAYEDDANVSRLWIAWLDGGDLRSHTLAIDGVVSAASACSMSGSIHISTTTHPIPGLEREGGDVLELRVLDLD